MNLNFKTINGLIIVACFSVSTGNAADRWDALYEPVKSDGIPCRVMKPLNFDSQKSYPVIVSLHGAGGKGTNNDKQLKDWNRQLSEQQRRKDFPCYVVAPQAPGLWNEEHLKSVRAIIKELPSVEMDRIYIMGHSMGGHGTYIFIQLDPEYFAAAAPSAGPQNAPRNLDSRRRSRGAKTANTLDRRRGEFSSGRTRLSSAS
jgi:predicted peptidase